MKKKNVIPGNTQRANNIAAKTLKAYIPEIGDQAFEKFSRLYIFITYAEVEVGNHEINSLSTVLEYEAQPRVIQPSDCEI